MRGLFACSTMLQADLGLTDQCAERLSEYVAFDRLSISQCWGKQRLPDLGVVNRTPD